MPKAKGFASEAQRTRAKGLLAKGAVTQAQFDAWNGATAADLPKRATPAAAAGGRRGGKTAQQSTYQRALGKTAY